MNRTHTILAALAGLFILSAPTTASAATYFIQMGGMCSTDFLDGKGSGRMGNFSGITEINAQIDQTNNMGTAVAQYKALLDQRCRVQDGNRCYLYSYSNGGAVMSKTLSVYGTGQWDIVWAMGVASNEGGSELSDAADSWLIQAVAELFFCDLTPRIGVSDHRNAWNHFDTDGRTFYMIAGSNSWASTCAFFPGGMCFEWLGTNSGEADGVVAMHSAGGFANAGSMEDACDGDAKYSNHTPAWYCHFDKDHYGMKMKGIYCLEGNCSWN